MEPTTAATVLAVWASIGSLFYEPPPCDGWMTTQYLDDNGVWVNEAARCTDRRLFW